MPADAHEVTLQTLAYGGEALGRLEDGRAVFVPFGLPGERVRVRLVEEKRSHARAELIELIQPAADRITPLCKHFGICGGCQYQHMPYERQVEVKAGILRDQLTRIGRIENPPVQPTVPCPSPWNYRNQVQFHLTPDGKLGYVRAAERQGPARGVFAVEECHLPVAAISALWPQLEFEGRSGIQRVSIRAGEDDELLLALEGDSPDLPEVEIGTDVSVAHTFENNFVVMAGRGSVVLRVHGRDFRISPLSFFQVNTVMAEKMVEHVQALVPASGRVIFDIYCGVGLFSAFLAPRCERLIGIESSASACEDFGINLDEFENVELYEATAEAVLPSLNIKPDMALVDPPRAGMAHEALEALVASKPGRIIYVSCDPSTLARDARRMIEEGYHLLETTPFDLFPQTYHIESISILER